MRRVAAGKNRMNVWYADKVAIRKPVGLMPETLPLPQLMNKPGGSGSKSWWTPQPKRLRCAKRCGQRGESVIEQNSSEAYEN
jgi:hypothetical protein